MKRVLINTSTPILFDEASLKAIKDLIAQGRQNNVERITQTLKQAAVIAFACFEDNPDVIIGVCVIKNKNKDYVNRIKARAGFSSDHTILYEIGYLYVKPENRKKGTASVLLARLCEISQFHSLFATTSNDSVKRMLIENGFEQCGRQYPSEINSKCMLTYFERPV